MNDKFCSWKMFILRIKIHKFLKFKKIRNHYYIVSIYIVLFLRCLFYLKNINIAKDQYCSVIVLKNAYLI